MLISTSPLKSKKNYWSLPANVDFQIVALNQVRCQCHQQTIAKFPFTVQSSQKVNKIVSMIQPSAGQPYRGGIFRSGVEKTRDMCRKI